MKNKDIISALVGGTFFAIPYIGMSVTLAPAIAIGALAYGASELVLSGINTKKDLKDIDYPLYLKVNAAKRQNKEIYNLISKVESIETRKNLSSIYESVNKILDTLVMKPKLGKKLNNFFDYYLPVLIKIVKKYDEVENKRLKSTEGLDFMKKADKMIKDTSGAFEMILDSLYQSDIMDADAEMKVYNMMLKADGITGSELMDKGSEKNEK